MDADSITKGFGRLIAAAGVRRITFHRLRHTHISHQLMDGVRPKPVSERAGHAGIAITLQFTQHSFRRCRPKPQPGLMGGYARARGAGRWQLGGNC
jgi:integrase